MAKDEEGRRIPAETQDRIRQREAELLGKPSRLPSIDRYEKADEVLAATHTLRANLFGDVPRLSIDEVPEIMVTMLPFGTLWERVMNLSMGVMGPASTVPIRDQKLAILRTGWLLQAPFEFGEHVKQARALGFASEEIARVTEQGSSAPEWTEHERAVLRFAEELRENVYVSDATWSVLSKSFSLEQLFELCVLVGQFTTVAYFQNSLRIGLEEGNEGLSAR
jgi:alkylhydroperoxidase family enzyme